MPIAAPSWHVDHSGYITCPATGNYPDDWLAGCTGGVSVSGKSSQTAILAWLDAADLSPLNDNEDRDGHQALCNSLIAAVADIEWSRAAIAKATN